MARPSTMLPLGTPAPPFALPDTDGRTVSQEDARGARALLVMFICNHCPYVVHLRDALAGLAREYAPRGVAIVGINSNDPAQYPEDAPEPMRRMREAAGWDFPYLFDETQEVAKAFRAACTPDFFLFGPDHRLVYRGQFDSSRPSNGVPVTGRDLRGALDALLEGRPIPAEQAPSLGCGIKWRPGNAPEAAPAGAGCGGNFPHPAAYRPPTGGCAPTPPGTILLVSAFPSLSGPAAASPNP